jgi:hypothetical protein
LKKVSIVLFSIFFSIVIIEMFLILFGYQKKQIELINFVKTNNYFTLDTKRVYKINPGHVSDNYWSSDNYGFRFSESHKDYLKNDYENSIFFVGDSFIYGHGVINEETIPSFVEDKIQSKKVINAGVPGYGLDQEYEYILEIVGNYNPKVIFWGININDVTDSSNKCLFKAIGSKKYFKLSGIFNTFFIRNYFVQKIPLFLFEKFNVLDIAVSYLRKVGEDGYFTIGCSNNVDYEEKSKLVLKKLNYFIKQIEIINSKSQTQFVLLLMPTQMYFDRDYYNEYLNNHYFGMKNIIKNSGFVFIDLNVELARKFDSSLLSYRRFGGDKYFNKSLSCFENLAKHLFLTVDSSKYGNMHLNSYGNELVSEILLNVIY